MKLQTSEARILSVPEMWKEQYFTNQGGSWGRTINGDASVIYNQLLGARGDQTRTDKIIGNPGWTRYWCHECNEYRDRAVQFEGSDFPIDICEECIGRAFEMLRT